MPNTYLSWPHGVLKFITEHAIEVWRRGCERTAANEHALMMRRASDETAAINRKCADA